MVSIEVSCPTDFATLGARWRDLEQRSKASFFQCWTWVGCLCAERFPDPVLVAATEAGHTVALGLFNRVKPLIGLSRLHLNASGSAELDCPYVEQNGILTEAGREEELTVLCLRPLLICNNVILSGVGAPVVAAAKRAAGLVLTERRQACPFVDLATVRGAGADYLAGRSANTRQQIRRSDRFYQQQGPIRLDQASSPENAHAMLDRLAERHQAVWQRRGLGGSFARQFFARFHHALIDTGFSRQEVTLLEVSCAETVIGVLYNFVWQGRMSAYQSGFVYRDDSSHAKPGLTCHHLAINHAIRNGFEIYDFLAGEDRYKQSLADQSYPQFWLVAGPFWSPWLLLRTLVGWLRAIPRQARLNRSAK